MHLHQTEVVITMSRSLEVGSTKMFTYFNSHQNNYGIEKLRKTVLGFEFFFKVYNFLQ